MSRSTRRPILALVGFGILVCLTAVGLWKTSGELPDYSAVSIQPEGIMGTECQLTAIVPRGREASAAPALATAEAELRRIEALMSSWLADSEISRLNRAGTAVATPLSAESLALLREARRLSDASLGAFDVTCRPLIELWRRAGASGVLPSEAALEHARTLTGWRQMRLRESDVLKGDGEARVDLGGIAKGYGIDRAAETLLAAGVRGGVVDVGGDLRIIGHGLDEGPVRVQIRSPFEASTWGEIALYGGAVCTSAHYARHFEIEGKTYSHIIDPRSGRPADAALSVTVVAPTALLADAWATALSVLGPEGLSILPRNEGVEALVFHGTAASWKTVTSPGFPVLIRSSSAGSTDGR